MKGKLAVSRLSRGLRAIFALIYWSLPIKVLFNTQTFSVTSWTNNFWCFTLDFCLTLKTMFGQLDYMAEIATCPYFCCFQRTDQVNRNFFFHQLKNDASFAQEITRASQTYRKQNQFACPACCAFLSRRLRLPWHAQKMCAVTIVGTVLNARRGFKQYLKARF